MKYTFKDCRTGKKAIYKTTLEIIKEENNFHFIFCAENSQYFCPKKKYNAIHSVGDACEILIGSDPDRKNYFEIEISPNNGLFCALMDFKCEGRKGLKINYVKAKDKFVKSKTAKTKNGYIAELIFPIDKIITGNDDIYFNAYRLETDGGVKEKHLFALNPTMKGRFHCPQKFVYIKNYLGE